MVDKIRNLKVYPPRDPSPFAKYGKTVEFIARYKSDLWYWALSLTRYGDANMCNDGRIKIRLLPWYEDGVIKKLKEASC